MARPRLDTTNEYLGKADEFSINDIGNGPPDIEVIDRVLPDDYAEIEKFMQEPVTIMIHESTDPNDVDLVEVGECEGSASVLHARQPANRAPLYVERLARMKKTSFSQNLDERLGEHMNTMRPHHALRRSP